MEHQTKIEAVKAAPALVGSALSAVTLNEIVALVTICYILLQAAYLVWKWHREAKGSTVKKP